MNKAATSTAPLSLYYFFAFHYPACYYRGDVGELTYYGFLLYFYELLMVYVYSLFGLKFLKILKIVCMSFSNYIPLQKCCG
jgi:hypothetical protein